MSYLDLHEFALTILTGLNSLVEQVFDFMSYTIPGVNLSVASVLFGVGLTTYLVLRVVF